MSNETLALTYWVQENLYVTTETLSQQKALRWFRLFLQNREEFFGLAIYGFVLRRQLDLNLDVYPESEFNDFCREFLTKLSLVQRGLGATYPVPMFARAEGKSQASQTGGTPTDASSRTWERRKGGSERTRGAEGAE